MNNNHNNLYKKLVDYSQSGIYPFHMPGHKRNTDFLTFSVDPCLIDVTEFGDMDNLHEPNGMLLECQKKIAALYHVDNSFILTNGSTGGIIAAILSCCTTAGPIIVARNSHKSVYSGIYLSGAIPHYIYPEITAFGLAGGLSPGEVMAAFQKKPDAKAIVVTSPTYEGFVCDIKGIAEIAHQYNAILIVDEAHGAHFNFSSAFPVSSAQLGADIVVQSLHKTLPSLTQTAMLHVQGPRVNLEMLRNTLGMVNTSSPSYVLMASMDMCINNLIDRGSRVFNAYVEELKTTREYLTHYKNIGLLEYNAENICAIHDVDISKLVFITNRNVSGYEVDEILVKKHKIQIEMAAENHIVAMSTVADTTEGLERLKQAIASIDYYLENREMKQIPYNIQYPRARYTMHPCEAMHKSNSNINLKDACGRVSAGYFTPYPPGIPLIAPGETISSDVIAYAGAQYANASIRVLGDVL